MKLTARNITASALTLAALLASACHTIEGAGKDVESVGDEVEDVTDN